MFESGPDKEKIWRRIEPYYYYQGNCPTNDLAALRIESLPEHEILLIQRKHTAPQEPDKWGLPGGYRKTEVPGKLGNFFEHSYSQLSKKFGEEFAEKHHGAMIDQWNAQWRREYWEEAPLECALREFYQETGGDKGLWDSGDTQKSRYGIDLRGSGLKVFHLGEFNADDRNAGNNSNAWNFNEAFAVILDDRYAHRPILGSDDVQDARWCPLSQLPLPADIPFDQEIMIAKALLVAKVGVPEHWKNAIWKKGKTWEEIYDRVLRPTDWHPKANSRHRLASSILTSPIRKGETHFLSRNGCASFSKQASLKTNMHK